MTFDTWRYLGLVFSRCGKLVAVVAIVSQSLRMGQPILIQGVAWNPFFVCGTLVDSAALLCGRRATSSRLFKVLHYNLLVDILESSRRRVRNCRILPYSPLFEEDL